MSTFSEAIGLTADWPFENNQSDEMSLVGLAKWARSYFDAGEVLHFTKHKLEPEFYAGPVIQTIGLATELTLKTMLRGGGKSSGAVRQYSHNTYKAYCEARTHFDELKFIELHFSNTAHLSAPEEVRARWVSDDKADIETRWRVYFDHLRLLDSVYDRPYRTRYPTPGLMELPDTEIILVGTKLLLTAMQERLAN